MTLRVTPQRVRTPVEQFQSRVDEDAIRQATWENSKW